MMKNVQQNSRRWAGMVGMMCLLAVSLSSCLKNSNDTVQPPIALLSVINASPDAPPLDFYLSDNKANAYSFGFGNGLDYISAYTGKRTATFTAAGTKTVYKADTLTLNENRYYSLFLANTAGHEEFVVLKDTIVKPADTKASVRFINLSTDAPAVDLVIKDGATLFANKSYKGFSGFVPINAAKYTLEVRQAGTTTVLATITNVMLNNGSLYTIWLQGLAAAGTIDAKKLSAKIQTNVYYY
ncbi:DUF4397 domain-containing protein [Mucilaginibacter gilvus]|uniref:DUF4397 domain-containing protein n=1 Tax=Mucilaginibacter gilvus TaxID=2305909 RepID=A0A3S3YWX0_9SPHI|nr:DUF4397 domain-containing protein [Mucilaginibacter gilvus]RWY47861.1 DUF4397 domain-containing protein [Mucilaginibacter gilvus]